MKRNLSAEIEKVRRFNENNKVGCAVVVNRDNGEQLVTTTRSQATVLFNNAVVWVRGISGCYLLDRVHPINFSSTGGQDVRLIG